MKKLISILALVSVLLYACNRNEDTTPAVDILSVADSTASALMAHELESMHHSLDSLLLTPHHNEQVHHDSIYHHHDSLYWHYHNEYRHGTYAHDDHQHDWVPYDTTQDHSHHFHHSYPNHELDSLITTPNHHAHSNSDSHHPGHDLNEHHELDSLHNVHNLHHP